MFVEITDFDSPPYSLPNLAHRKNSFLSYAEYLEKDALTRLLGYDFYIRLLDGIENADQIWLDVRDGVSYEYEGFTQIYSGLKDFLIPYIYANWLIEDQTKQTGAGNTVGKAKNSVVVSSARDIVKGWNNYVEKLGFNHVSVGYYSRYDNHVTNHKSTLYGLLKSNDLYGEFEYNYPGTINIMNL